MISVEIFVVVCVLFTIVFSWVVTCLIEKKRMIKEIRQDLIKVIVRGNDEDLKNKARYIAFYDF